MRIGDGPDRKGGFGFERVKPQARDRELDRRRERERLRVAGLVLDGRELLREHARTREGGPPNAESLAKYAKDVRRMARRRLLPERMAGCKATFYRLRAAALALAAERAGDALNRMEAMAKAGGFRLEDGPKGEPPSGWREAADSLSAAVETMRRYPPGEAETFVRDGRRCLWEPALVHPSMLGLVGRSTDVERVQEALPQGWRETVWREAFRSGTSFLDAIAVGLATGCRPHELRKGVSVLSGKDGMRICVRGAKTNRGHGLRLRSLPVEDFSLPWMSWLRDAAMQRGSPSLGEVRRLDVTAPSRNGYADAFAAAADRCGFWKAGVWDAAEGRRDAVAVSLATSLPPGRLGPVSHVRSDAVGFTVLPAKGDPFRVATPSEPWEIHLKDAAVKAGGLLRVAFGNPAEWGKEMKRLKRESPLGRVSPYNARHAISAILKSELSAMSPEERRDGVRRALGHASGETSGGYGRAGAAKGRSGLGPAKGASRSPGRSSAPSRGMGF